MQFPADMEILLMFPLRMALLDAAFMLTVRDENCESIIYLKSDCMMDSIADARIGFVALILCRQI
jgi:hypothetical protein